MPQTLVSQAIKLLTTVIISMASLTAQAKPSSELDIARCWAFPLESASSQISSDELRVYVASEGGRVTALLLNGQKSWSSDLGGEIVSNLIPWGDSIFFATASDGSNRKSLLRVMSSETGIVGAAFPLPEAERHFLTTFNDSLIVVSANGVVHSLDGKGATKWRREIAAGFVGSPAFGSGKLHVGATGKQVFTIDLVTGEIESVRRMSHEITAVGVTAGGSLAVGDERGYVTSLAPDGRDNWRFRTGARVSRIFAANGHLFAVSHDNFVYCLDVSNGNVIWKRRLDARATHSIAVNANYVFTTALDEHGAALTSVATGKPAGQVIFSADEWVTTAPASVGSSLFVATNTAVALYSLAGTPGCPK